MGKDRKDEVEEKDRILVAGRPNYNRTNNMVRTSKYTALSFIPIVRIFPFDHHCCLVGNHQSIVCASAEGRFYCCVAASCFPLAIARRSLVLFFACLVPSSRLLLSLSIIAPQAVMEQFRRFANLYFLCVGCIMAVGYYSPAFQSAINPWTTLGPLGIVISFSLLVEGSGDLKRHRNDEETNNALCVILRRSDDFEADDSATEKDTSLAGGKDVVVSHNQAYILGMDAKEAGTPKGTEKSTRICFQKIRRMDIRQGHLIVVKNREMVPADMLLIASSSENGSGYIETSSIDGETNLKLRTSPHLPKKILKHLRDGTPLDKMESINENDMAEDNKTKNIETIEEATRRVARFSALCYPKGVCVLRKPDYKGATDVDVDGNDGEKGGLTGMFRKGATEGISEYFSRSAVLNNSTTYVAALTSEPPNPHVNTFTGKLTVPPVEKDGDCHDIPLGAENVLLRGAVLRNTEWAIGLVVFTGTDTKLVRNSFETPSKFSQLDKLMNHTVLLILLLNVCIISYMSTQSVITTSEKFDELWYVPVLDIFAIWLYNSSCPLLCKLYF